MTSAERANCPFKQESLLAHFQIGIYNSTDYEKTPLFLKKTIIKDIPPNAPPKNVKIKKV